MNLTTTEKYALAVLDAYGKRAALQKKERAVCLAASCIWEMLKTGAVTADSKGKLRVAAPLPETLSYCRPIYERLAKKHRRPEKAAYDWIWTGKRIKTLTKSVIDGLIDHSVLVVEQKNAREKAGQCHVDGNAIADDLAALRQLDETAAPEQTDLGVLLLESGTAKKLLGKQDFSRLKKGMKRIDSEFKTHVKKAVKLYQVDKAIMIACIVSSSSS